MSGEDNVKTVSVRLTIPEYYEVKEKANKIEVSLSEYIRLKILNEK